jgi:hypothetical protein
MKKTDGQKIVKKFKVTLENRVKDTELKMKIVYDTPITALGDLIGFLEKYRRNK